MTPRISGKTRSSSSEGSNKYFSFKRIIPNLKMIILVTRNRPKMTLQARARMIPKGG